MKVQARIYAGNGGYVHSFCLGVSELYTQVVSKAYTEDASERANNKFGHFLDCEAHTDVWRELFPTANLTNEKE